MPKSVFPRRTCQKSISNGLSEYQSNKPPLDLRGQIPFRKFRKQGTTMPTPSKTKTKEPKAALDGDSTDVTQILHQDHQHVNELFFQYNALEEDDNAGKNQLVRQIIKELTAHAKVEEELVYPAVRDVDSESEDLIDEADTEHHVIKFLLSELSEMEAGDDHFDAKVCVLSEIVRHHVQEEEKEIFEALRNSELDLDDLGQGFSTRKAILLKGPSLPDGMRLVTSSKPEKKKKK
jgi:hemerythrin superfamily protein